LEFVTQNRILCIVAGHNGGESSTRHGKTNDTNDLNENAEDLLDFCASANISVPHCGDCGDCEIKGCEVRTIGLAQVIHPGYLTALIKLGTNCPQTTDDMANKKEPKSKNEDSLEPVTHFQDITNHLSELGFVL
jgi:hypothetical protein